MIYNMKRWMRLQSIEHFFIKPCPILAYRGTTIACNASFLARFSFFIREGIPRT